MIIKNKFPILISVIFIIAAAFIHLNILINVSPSIPKGIYLKTTAPPKRGSLVSLCLPENYIKIGLENHYLISGSGTCDGMLPLLKEIVAIPGDDVVLMNDSILVNGKIYNFSTRDRDSNGNLMSIYPRGHYPHTTGYWLLGTADPKSWDSRYWGFVPRDFIKNSLLPIFTH